MLAASAAWLLLAGAAAAQCDSGCGSEPPSDCGAGGGCSGQPPAPPPGGGGSVNVNVNVNAGASASANAGASAYINARAGGFSSASGGGSGGGSAYVSVQQPAPMTIQNLAVEGLTQIVRRPVDAVRRVRADVLLQAICMDDRQTPHPASQVRPDRDVPSGYAGELYRCLAGTRLQALLSDKTDIEADGPRALTCEKGEALWLSAEGRLDCRPQTPQRDCHERSLLRRYGAGVKRLTLVREEHYTDYVEERASEGAVLTGALTLDGGVGGRVF